MAIEKVLIIDDEELLLNYMKDILHKLGIEATCFLEGKKALEALKNNQLTDLGFSYSCSFFPTQSDKRSRFQLARKTPFLKKCLKKLFVTFCAKEFFLLQKKIKTNKKHLDQKHEISILVK